MVSITYNKINTNVALYDSHLCLSYHLASVNQYLVGTHLNQGHQFNRLVYG